MNAWELLTAHSSLSSGSAWDHLNNQRAASSITSEGISVKLQHSIIVAQLDDNVINATYMPLETVIDSGEITVGTDI
jgi:hypothetical protein